MREADGEPDLHRSSRAALTPEEFLAVIHDVEGRYPVATWRAAGTHVWPVIRTRSMRYNEATRASAVQGGDAGAPGRTRDALLRVARGAAEAVLTNLVDRRNRVPLRPPRAQVLMLGDAVSRILVDGIWYDRFVDPVVEDLAELGVDAVQVQPHHVYRRPRATPSRLVQPSLDVVDAWTRYAPLRGALSAPGWPEAAEELRRAGVPAAAVADREVLREATLVVREARRFLSLFHAVRPRLALHVDYTIPALAFTLAARRYGVPSVELQHAIPSATHPMYAAWRGAPAGGYEVLPTHYWTWERGPAEVLSAWIDDVVSGPTVLVGGNPWLERWLAGTGDLVARLDARLLQERARHAGLPHVLLTFETTFTAPGILGPMLAAVQTTRGRARWWYRLHPTMRTDEAQRVRAALAEHGGADSFTDMTGEPLYALLRHVDAHLTYASSTTQEAALFGVNTVLTSPHGADVFGPLVRQGWAQVQTEGDAIAAALLGLTRAQPEDRPDAGARSRAVLRELLAFTPPADVPRRDERGGRPL